MKPMQLQLVYIFKTRIKMYAAIYSNTENKAFTEKGLF